MEDEIWVDIKGYEGLYQVSNQGRIRSVEREVKTIRNGVEDTSKLKSKILKPSYTYGYLKVSLSKEGKQRYLKVHRLVAEAFIPNPDNKPDIDHINTIRDDNRVENLRWVTKKENNNNELSRKHNSNRQKERTGEKNSFYGKHHTEEAKKRMSESKPKKSVVQLTLDLKLIKIWECTRDTNKEGYNHAHVIKCCNGKSKTHKGYKWMYYEDYIKLNEKGEM